MRLYRPFIARDRANLQLVRVGVVFGIFSSKTLPLLATACYNLDGTRLYAKILDFSGEGGVLRVDVFCVSYSFRQLLRIFFVHGCDFY